jgi:hypothetical protein
MGLYRIQHYIFQYKETFPILRPFAHMQRDPIVVTSYKIIMAHKKTFTYDSDTSLPQHPRPIVS